jgi:hypothetical protein
MLLAARAAILAPLAILLTALASTSSLVGLLPEVAWTLWILMGVCLALLPALLARETPLPAAAFVVVPVLAASAYGASRLDWLRVLKDFGVAEPDALRWARLGLGALALVVLWTLHAADFALRLRLRATERGIDAAQANAATGRSARESAKAAAIALAGAAGLLGVGLLGLQLSSLLPTERGALLAPLLAAALLVSAAAWLAQGEKQADG